MPLTYAEQTRANITDACHADGNFCDGTNDKPYADGDCACGCHSLWAPTFLTYAEVRDYHLPSDVYRPATAADVADYRVRRIPTFDGTEYVLREQYRQHG